MVKPSNTEEINEILKTACEGCGKCCSDPVVPITDADIRRIYNHTQIHPKEFTKLYDENDGDFDDDCDSWIHFQYGKRFLGLKKQKGSERCTFLDESNRCSIYEARPMTCRSFPFSIELDEDEQLENLELTLITRESYPKGPAKKLDDLIELARKEDDQDIHFFDLIERWNDKKKKFRKNKKAFLKYLGFK